MTEKTLQELQAEQAAIQVQIEKLEIAPLQAINAALSDSAFSNAIAVLEANVDHLTGNRHQQAHNVLTVLQHSPGFLVEEFTAMDARLNPPPPPEAQAVSEQTEE